MYKLYHGDCLERIDQLIQESIKFDAIIADPPYGTTACSWDYVIPFDKMWERLKALRKESAPIVLFGSEPFSSALRMSNIKEYKYDWIWNKKKGGNPLLSKIQPIKITENIIIFGKGKINYYPLMIKRDKLKARGNKTYKVSETTKNAFIENKTYKYKYPKSIIKISNASQINKVHPTQKPVALMEYLIKTYTKENDLVLDFTMGSGTTGVAAIKLKRNFIGIEIEEEHFKTAELRLKEQDSFNKFRGE